MPDQIRRSSSTGGRFSTPTQSTGPYADGHQNDLGGYEGHFGLLHGRSISDYSGNFHSDVDVARGSGFLGSSEDGRYGLGGDFSLLHYSTGYGQAGDGGNGQLDVNALHANVDAWFNPNDGIKLMAGASLLDAYGKGGNLGHGNQDRDGGFGLAAGPGLGGKLAWGDTDGDGYREYGFDFAGGPVMGHYRTEDPLQDALFMAHLQGNKHGIDTRRFLRPFTNDREGQNLTEELGMQTTMGLLNGTSELVNGARNTRDRTANEIGMGGIELIAGAQNTVNEVGDDIGTTVDTAVSGAGNVMQNAGNGLGNTAGQAIVDGLTGGPTLPRLANNLGQVRDTAVLNSVLTAANTMQSAQNGVDNLKSNVANTAMNTVVRANQAKNELVSGARNTAINAAFKYSQPLRWLTGH